MSDCRIRKKSEEIVSSRLGLHHGLLQDSYETLADIVYGASAIGVMSPSTEINPFLLVGGDTSPVGE